MLIETTNVVSDQGAQGILLLIIGGMITFGGSLFLVLFREIVKSMRLLNRTLNHIDRRLVAVEVKMEIPITEVIEGDE